MRAARTHLLPLIIAAAVLAACGGRPAASSIDGSADGSPTRRDSDVANDTTAPDALPPPDAAIPDAPTPSGFQQYLLWQSPGGYAGWGPAIEILSDGTVHLWRQVSTMQPHNTSGWDFQLKLSAKQRDEIFALLRSTSYGKLPHQSPGSLECYPHLHYNPCVGAACALSTIDLAYDQPQDLRPELDDVYKWLDVNIGAKHSDVTMPDQYCLFFP